MKRVLCLTLTILMVLPLLFSCGERKEDQDAPSATDPTEAVGEDISDAEDAAAETEITRENIPDTLPDDLDFDGKTCTIYYSNGRDRFPFIEGGEELSGEIVSDSVFNCNESVAKRLNVDLRYYDSLHRVVHS